MEAAVYYYIVARISLTRSAEAVNFYVALKNAGLPVILLYADTILARLKGEDYVGIIPHMVTSAYCGDMFLEKFGRILDYIHIYEEDMRAYGDQIQWLPIEEVGLDQTKKFHLHGYSDAMKPSVLLNGNHLKTA